MSVRSVREAIGANRDAVLEVEWELFQQQIKGKAYADEGDDEAIDDEITQVEREQQQQRDRLVTVRSTASDRAESEDVREKAAALRAVKARRLAAPARRKAAQDNDTGDDDEGDEEDDSLAFNWRSKKLF